MDFADFIYELGRPERDKSPSPVFRRGTVTAVGTDDDGVSGVQTTLSADAWLPYLDGQTLSVDDDVMIVQQGTDMWVLGRLAA